MTTLNIFLILLILSWTAARRRPCDDDCDCRMSKGHRCVYRRERNNLIHCSLKPGSGEGSCFCLRSCVLMDGTMIRKGKMVSRPCSNRTCVIPIHNKASCVDNKADCQQTVMV